MHQESSLLLNFDEGLLMLIMVFPADWNDFMLVLQVALGYFLHIHVLVIIILAMHYVPKANNLFRNTFKLSSTEVREQYSIDRN